MTVQYISRCGSEKLVVLRFILSSQEVELVKSLPYHPNIVKYIAAWQEELHFYVVMEYCRCTLAKLVSMVKVDERFLWNVLFQVNCTLIIIRDWRVAQIARALEHIHKHDVLHMDVKPGNILYGIDKVKSLFLWISMTQNVTPRFLS